jgi:hypothetical protein
LLPVNKLATGLFMLPILALACSARVIDGGSNAPIVVGDAASPQPACNAPAISSAHYDAAAIATAKARCQDPTHGPVDPYASPADLTNRLAHAWYSCNTDDQGYGAGVLFSIDGKMIAMQLDPDGGISSRVGLDAEGTWTIDEEGANAQPSPGFCDTKPGNVPFIFEHRGGESTVKVGFELTPVRLRLENMGSSSSFVTWFVPLDS